MTEKSKEQKQKEEEIARQQWDSWIVDLEEKEQPENCSIDDEGCETCSS